MSHVHIAIGVIIGRTSLSPLDLFADLRPNMTRYSGIEEVNAALLEVEENERSGSVEKTSGGKHSDSDLQKTPKKAIAAVATRENRNLANGIEINGQGHDEGESESYSDSGSIGHNGREDEDLDEDDGSVEDDDEEEDGGIGSDDDDNVQVRQKLVEVDPREEEEFDREFRAMMQESIDSRKLELRARPALNMMIPMNVFEGSKDTRAAEGESGEDTVDEEGGSGGNKVRVKVLVKRGNKQQMKQMYIPEDCSLVQSTKEKEAAELEEKQNIKRRILEYNEREEEESSSSISTQSTNWPQLGSTGNIRPAGHGTWDGSGRTGGGPRNRPYHPSTGYYYGYSRRK